MKMNSVEPPELYPREADQTTPVYAQQHRVLINTEYDVWHLVDRVIAPAQRGEEVVPSIANPLDFKTTVVADCMERFEPVALLYKPRTLIDWGDDDDLCECAAALPTEDECKAKGTRLIMDQPVRHDEDG